MDEYKYYSYEYQEIEKSFWKNEPTALKVKEYNIVNRLAKRLRKRNRKSKHPRWERPSKN